MMIIWIGTSFIRSSHRFIHYHDMTSLYPQARPKPNAFCLCVQGGFPIYPSIHPSIRTST